MWVRMGYYRIEWIYCIIGFIIVWYYWDFMYFSDRLYYYLEIWSLNVVSCEIWKFGH